MDIACIFFFAFCRYYRHKFAERRAIEKRQDRVMAVVFIAVLTDLVCAVILVQ